MSRFTSCPDPPCLTVLNHTISYNKSKIELAKAWTGQPPLKKWLDLPVRTARPCLKCHFRLRRRRKTAAFGRRKTAAFGRRKSKPSTGGARLQNQERRRRLLRQKIAWTPTLNRVVVASGRGNVREGNEKIGWWRSEKVIRDGADGQSNIQLGVASMIGIL